MEVPSPPLGYVIKGPIRVELLGLRRWRVTIYGRDDPRGAEHLEAFFSPRHHVEDEGAYGRLMLETLARRIGGRAVYPGSDAG